MFRGTEIGLCNTHLMNNVYQKLVGLSKDNTMKPGSNLERIAWLWCGSSFLNISEDAGHDQMIKDRMMELAAVDLAYCDGKIEEFERYIEKYFTRTGQFSMNR